MAEADEADLPQLHLGEVCQTDATKGYSFIKCPTGDFNSDVFVHRNVVDPSILCVGDQVACTVEIGPKGKPQAQAPVWRLQGNLRPGQELELGEFVGEIREITLEGNALVECEDVLEAHGKNAFLHSKVVQQCGLNAGDVIGFHVHVSTSGCPQVSAPCWKDCSHASASSSSQPVSQNVDSEASPRGTFKRQLCKFFEAGNCSKGARCNYAHGEAERQKNPEARLCRHFMNGHCDKGEKCTFVHGEDELRGAAWDGEDELGAAWAPPSEALSNFVEVNGIDDHAADLLFNSTPEIQAEVLAKSNLEFANNPSAMLTKFIAGIRKSGLRPQALQKVKDRDVQQFVEANGIDSAAADALWSCTSEVKAVVLATANFHGARNPSAVLVKLILTTKQDPTHSVAWQQPVQPSAPPPRRPVMEQPLAKAARTSSSKGFAGGFTGGFLFGQVVSADPAKGCSLVDCPDSGYERNIYVRSLVAPPRKCVNVGDTVAFRIKDDPGVGGAQAIAPLFRLVGAAENEEAPTEIGMYVGRLARIKEDGCGFVVSETIANAYAHLPKKNQDAFIVGAIIERCGLELGDTIAFTVSENRNGCPQVQAPCWKCCSAEGIESIQDTTLHMRGAEPKEEALTSFSPASGYSNKDESYREHYYVGRVKKKDPNIDCPQFCNIECPQSGYDRDVFMHASTADPALVEEGQFVAFPLHVNAKGFPQASRPLWRLSGDVVDDSYAVFGDWFGQLKEKLTSGPAAGISFMVCDELKEQYGREAFVHESVIEKCEMVLGETVAFSVHISPRGHPQVSAPLWKLCSEEKYTPSLGAVITSPHYPEVPTGKGKGKYDYEPATKGLSKAKGKGKSGMDLEGSYAVGWVTKVMEEKTMSIVEVPGAGLDRGVVVHFSAADQLCVDDTVFFMLHTMADKGKGTRAQASKHAPVWKLVGRKPQGQVSEIGQYLGKVKNINAHGGAHVLCPELLKEFTHEAYLMSEVLKETGLLPGDAIYFNMHVNAKGLPQVTSPCWKNASPYEPEALVGLQSTRGVKRKEAPEVDADIAKVARASEAGVHAVGWVKMIDREKGYSMVDVPNSGYDRDVWVSGKMARPEMLTVGDTVFFQIHVNSRNMPQAAPPVWRLVGAVPAEGNVATIGSFKGKVREVNEDGSAFVDCPDVVAAHGGLEAWLHSEVLDETGVRPNDMVFFDVSGTNLEGHPQVSSPMWKSCSEEKWTPIGSNSVDQAHEAPQTPPEDSAEHFHNSPPKAGGNDGWRPGRPAGAPAPWSKPERHVESQPSWEPEPTQQDLPPLAHSQTPMSPPRDPRHMRPAHQRPPPPHPQTAPPVLPVAVSQEYVSHIPNSAGSAVGDSSPLREGEAAEIYGLSSEAGQQLNNLRVTVVKILDTGRVQVRFAPEAQRPQDVRLKSANLRRLMA